MLVLPFTGNSNDYVNESVQAAMDAATAKYSLVPDIDEAEKDLPRIQQLSRILRYLPAWRKITSDPLILSILTSGYRIEWDPEKGEPERCDLRNHPSCEQHEDFVSAEIQKGLKMGVFKEIQES